MDIKHNDPDWLQPDFNYIFTKDDDAQRVLVHFGMMGSVPNPHHEEGSECGYAMYSDITPSFFMVMFRSCNCEQLPDNTYAVMFISRKRHSVKDAFEIRDVWLKALFSGAPVNVRAVDFPEEDRN
jgi:hypothetical protein